MRKRPAVERGFPFPKQFAVAMDALAARIVFCQSVAEQAQIKKIGRDRLELEGRLVAFVQRAHVGPDPAEAMFLQQPDEMWPMPAGVAEFDRETKIRRQLRDEIPKGRFLFPRRIGRRELNEDDAQLGRERFERAEKGGQLRAAIAQPPSWVISRGNLQANRKCAGVISTQRRATVSEGAL